MANHKNIKRIVVGARYPFTVECSYCDGKGWNTQANCECGFCDHGIITINNKSEDFFGSLRG